MQRCHRASGRYSAALSIRPRQASEMMSCTPLRPRSTRWRRNADQPDLSSLAFADAQNLSKTFGIDGAGHKQRDVADLAGPGSLHYDAIEIKVRMLTLDAAVPPSLDFGVDLFVEVGHCTRAHPRPPQSFGDVLHPTHRNARQIHLDQRLLDRALAAPVPVDDRRLKGLAAQLWNLEIHFARAGLQCPLIAAGPGVLTSLAALVTASAAELVRLSIQHGIQRLFHRATNQLAKMVPDTGFIDLDHLTHRLLVTHRLLLHCMKKPSILKVRKILYVIKECQSPQISRTEPAFAAMKREAEEDWEGALGLAPIPPDPRRPVR